MDRITGRAIMCDPDAPSSVRPLPSLATPKDVMPLHLIAGDGRLYVIDAFPEPTIAGGDRHSFEALSYDDASSFTYKNWRWHPLPPPVYVHGRRAASILVYNNAGRTYRYDTAARAWAKAGNWPAMPFTGLAEHVPGHGGLLFGLSAPEPEDDGCQGSHFCAARSSIF
ncbi:hypothetical protein ACP4OV_018607 [Aristida adscensionis]